MLHATNGVFSSGSVVRNKAVTQSKFDLFVIFCFSSVVHWSVISNEFDSA